MGFEPPLGNIFVFGILTLSLFWSSNATNLLYGWVQPLGQVSVKWQNDLIYPDKENSFIKVNTM